MSIEDEERRLEEYLDWYARDESDAARCRRLGRFLIVADAICLVGCIAFVPMFPLMAAPAVLVGFALYMMVNGGAWNA